jgi:hypothetical protein
MTRSELKRLSIGFFLYHTVSGVFLQTFAAHFSPGQATTSLNRHGIPVEPSNRTIRMRIVRFPCLLRVLERVRPQYSEPEERRGGAVASGSIKDLKLVGVALATQRGKNRCGEREFQGKLQWPQLLLAMTDPAPHPALFAADFTATFTSTTAGHAFSSGLSEAHIVHDSPMSLIQFGGTLLYNQSSP